MINTREFRARLVEDVYSTGINNGVAKKALEECEGEDSMIASFRKLKRCDETEPVSLAENAAKNSTSNNR